jgi:hypothetical protein
MVPGVECLHLAHYTSNHYHYLSYKHYTGGDDGDRGVITRLKREVEKG